MITSESEGDLRLDPRTLKFFYILVKNLLSRTRADAILLVVTRPSAHFEANQMPIRTRAQTLQFLDAFACREVPA